MSLPRTAESGGARGFPVRTVGPLARRLLGQAADGRVAAVFRSAFYVETTRGLLCVGTAALEPGPVTLVTAAPAGADWRDLGVSREARAVVAASALRVGGRFRFPFGAAADWQPERIAGPVAPAAAARGLAALRTVFSGRPVAEGLGRFVDPGYVPRGDHREGAAAARCIAGARGWLKAALGAGETVAGHPDDWAGGLTGLGPGLTPSGDDFLGGVMLALHALGQAGLTQVIWDCIRPGLGRETNSISAALLGAASEGFGSAAVHAAMAAVLRGDPALPAAVRALDRIGHSSGWDAMAGVAAVLGAWLEAQRAPGRSPGP